MRRRDYKCVEIISIFLASFGFCSPLLFAAVLFWTFSLLPGSRHHLGSKRQVVFNFIVKSASKAFFYRQRSSKDSFPWESEPRELLKLWPWPATYGDTYSCRILHRAEGSDRPVRDVAGPCCCSRGPTEGGIGFGRRSEHRRGLFFFPLRFHFIFVFFLRLFFFVY